jgi:hypothetical protein
MKKSIIKGSFTILAIAMASASFAGNKDRSGQAGATELLINPWAASCGVFGANTSNVIGVEAMKGNIAGLAYVEGTEIGLAYDVYLKGAKVNVYNLGFAQKLGGAGVLGVNIQSMGFGDIEITDFNHPTGGVGTYKPQFFNVQVGFAKEFSHSIHAGLGLTVVSEQITNVRASGAAFEAGVQYVTGLQDNFHFGVTLRNVGSNMKYTGEGFSINSEAPENEGYTFNRQTPSEKFEMPTYLNIGAAYDFYLDGKHLAKADDQPKHRLTAMAAFTSNSFNNDYIAAGLEYGFREMFMLRAGYRYEKDITDDLLSTTFYKGFSAGASVATRLAGKGPRLMIDYSFRPTHRPDNGVHNFSLRFMLGKKGNAKAEPAE